MTPSWIGVGRRRPAGEDVADRRLGVGLDVEVVRQVALRVEVDGEDVEPGAPEDVGQVRTAVVLPVPPFCERTAIFWATRRQSRRRAARRPCGGSRPAERARIPQPGPLRPSPPRAFGPKPRSAGRPQGRRRGGGRGGLAPRGSAAGSGRRRSRRRRVRTRHSTRSPLTNTPLRLRSSSTRTPSGWRTISAWRRDTVGSSKRTSAARLRPTRVHSRSSEAIRTLAAVVPGQVLAGLGASARAPRRSAPRAARASARRSCGARSARRRTARPGRSARRRSRGRRAARRRPASVTT